jgi:hypothetical protein
LISTEHDVAGLGHAWTEICHKDKWLLLDATAPEGLVSDETACYLSLMTLDDEGPGLWGEFHVPDQRTAGQNQQNSWHFTLTSVAYKRHLSIKTVVFIEALFGLGNNARAIASQQRNF